LPLLVRLQRLPEELLYKIFAHLPKRAVPEELFDSAYFLRRWKLQHEVETSTIHGNDRTMIVVDGKLAKVTRREKDWVVVIDNYNSDGELVQSDTYQENILRCHTNYHQGRLHGDHILYRHNGEVSQHYIYEDGSLIQAFGDNDGVEYIEKGLLITSPPKWKRVIRSSLNSLHKLASGL